MVADTAIATAKPQNSSTAGHVGNTAARQCSLQQPQLLGFCATDLMSQRSGLLQMGRLLLATWCKTVQD